MINYGVIMALVWASSSAVSGLVGSVEWAITFIAIANAWFIAGYIKDKDIK